MQSFNFFSDIDDCMGESCDNGGTCIDGVASFQCMCPVGFTGMGCEISMLQNNLNSQNFIASERLFEILVPYL